MALFWGPHPNRGLSKNKARAQHCLLAGLKLLQKKIKKERSSSAIILSECFREVETKFSSFHYSRTGDSLFKYAVDQLLSKNKTEWPRQKKKKETSPERGRKTRGETEEAVEMKTEREELFEVGVCLIWNRLFTVGLPRGFHRGFMYNST